ncbi:MAG: tyrosine-protein phosphatase [Anaerolineae bacterium]
MIDIHNHILYGFDDGAQSLADSMTMAQMAADDGVTRIVATPHNLDWREAGLRSMVMARVSELQSELNQRHIPLEIVPGVEVYISPDLIQQLEDERAFTLNGSRYILVELPLSTYPHYTDQIFFELQIQGLTPIFAHPERNAVIGDDPSLLYELVSKGLLAQLTAASVVGLFGSKVRDLSRTLLEHNLVQVIATDSHGTNRRTPILSEAMSEAAKIVGQEQARAMVTTVPELILADQDVPVEPPLVYKPKRRWLWQR